MGKHFARWHARSGRRSCKMAVGEMIQRGEVTTAGSARFFGGLGPRFTKAKMGRNGETVSKVRRRFPLTIKFSLWRVLTNRADRFDGSKISFETVSGMRPYGVSLLKQAPSRRGASFSRNLTKVAKFFDAVGGERVGAKNGRGLNQWSPYSQWSL